MRAIRDRIQSLASGFSEINYSDEDYNDLIEDSISEINLSVTYNSETGAINSTDIDTNNKLFNYGRIKFYEKISDYYTDKAISISDGAGSGDFRKRAELLIQKANKYKAEYDKIYGKRNLLFSNLSSIR